MNNFISKAIDVIKKPSKLLTIILFSVTAFFNFLFFVGTFPNNFFPVIGQLFSMILTLVLDGLIVLLLVLKKDSWAKLAFYFIFAYFFISLLFFGFDSAGNLFNGANKIDIAASVFVFISTLATIASIVLYIIGRIKKSNLANIAFLIIACVFVLQFIALILFMAYYGTVNTPWPIWFYMISYVILYPLSLFFGFIYFIHGEEISIIQTQKANDTVNTEEATTAVEESSNDEQIVEETPVVEKIDNTEEPIEEESNVVEQNEEQTTDVIVENNETNKSSEDDDSFLPD
ncbi:MAG: hypothetical protein K5765_06425 [Clostridia bacterium]|nr:hypothetical protein [Clostridia bacterium]